MIISENTAVFQPALAVPVQVLPGPEEGGGEVVDAPPSDSLDEEVHRTALQRFFTRTVVLALIPAQLTV